MQISFKDYTIIDFIRRIAFIDESMVFLTPTVGATYSGTLPCLRMWDMVMWYNINSTHMVVCYLYLHLTFH